jgi:hypothetical protein
MDFKMKTCSYCGEENQNEARTCFGCGTAFPGAEPMTAASASNQTALSDKTLANMTARDLFRFFIKCAGLYILLTGLDYLLDATTIVKDMHPSRTTKYAAYYFFWGVMRIVAGAYLLCARTFFLELAYPRTVGNQTSPQHPSN